MQTPPPCVDPEAVQVRLRQLLFELLAKNGAYAFGSAEAIPNDVELSTVGLNSIDFLDFALSVEHEFGVEILDTIEPNDLPLTLRAWQQEVCNRLTSRQ